MATYVGNNNHSLYIKVIPEKRGRYNYKKQKYETISPKSLSMMLFYIDKKLKDREILHALFFNRVIFWRKPKFKILAQMYKDYSLYIGEFKSDKKSLHSIFYKLKDATSKDRLEIIINSHGGSIEEGRQFYNMIRGKFYNNSVAYLDNHGYSMGAVLFCIAKKRVIYPYSNLMFHNYHMINAGKGGEILAKVEHADKLNTKFRHDIVVKQGFLSEEEYQKLLIGQDFWMDAKELCKRGIATHVIIDGGEEITAKEYLETLCRDSKNI